MTEAEKKKAYMKAYREKHKEWLAVYNKKSCSDRYYRDHEANKQRKREQYEARKEIIKILAKQSRERNRENRAEQKRAYVVKNREKVADYHRKWWQSHRREQQLKKRARYKEHAEELKQKTLAWVRKYPERRAEILARRRARKMNAQIGTDRNAYRDFVRFVKTSNRIACHWCGKNVPKRKRHIDHIVPLVRGGKDDVHNLCCSCDNCNCSKGHKLPEEFSGQFVLQFNS